MIRIFAHYGLEFSYSSLNQSYIAHVVTCASTAEHSDYLFELLFEPASGITLRRHSPQQPAHWLTTSHPYGKVEAAGLFSVSAIGNQAESHPILRTTPLFGPPVQQPLEVQPIAIMHTASRVWIADSQQRIWCWKWQDGNLQPSADRPIGGANIVGRITALALWPDDDNDWFILATTDEQWLHIFDQHGNLLQRAPTRHITTTMVSDPDNNRIWTAFEDGWLGWLEPVRWPLASSPWPAVTEVVRTLPDWRGKINLWLTGSDTALAWAAATTQSEESTILSHLPNLREADISSGTALAILEALEKQAHASITANTSFLDELFSLARAWYGRCPVRYRRQVDLMTATMDAFYGATLNENEDFRWLNNARNYGDLNWADHLFERGIEAGAEGLQTAVNYYARILLLRRQVSWLFATRGNIISLAILPGGHQLLLGTRAGQILQIDTVTRELVSRYDLPEGTIPRGIVVDQLSKTSTPTFAVITGDGQLFLGSAIAENCLDTLQNAGRIAAEAWSLILVPQDKTGQPDAIVGLSGGRLGHYTPEQEGWTPIGRPTEVEAHWLHTMEIAEFEPGKLLILAGGALTSGQGILHILNLEGKPAFPPFEFPGPVWNVRLVKQPDLPQKSLAVVCADGYLYLVRADGVAYGAIGSAGQPAA